MNIISEQPYDLTINGTSITEGDVVRFMPLLNGGCAGATAADASKHGGALLLLELIVMAQKQIFII